jgi:hypothetical protein
MQARDIQNVTQRENKLPRGLITWNTTINLTLGSVAVVSYELPATTGVSTAPG